MTLGKVKWNKIKRKTNELTKVTTVLQVTGQGTDLLAAQIVTLRGYGTGLVPAWPGQHPEEKSVQV